MHDFDSPRLLLQMRTWIAGQDEIDEVWLERFYFDAAGKVRIAGFFTRAGHPRPERQARLMAAVMHSLSIRARSGAPRAVLEDLAADAIDNLVPA